MATRILKTQRKSIFSEKVTTETPENTPLVIQGSPNLIREGGRTVGSGRVATIIESCDLDFNGIRIFIFIQKMLKTAVP